MKKIFLLICILASLTQVFAQKIKYKKEQILLDDQAIAKLEKISNGAMQPSNFSLKTLEGTEILVAQIKSLTTTDGYFNYDIVFTQSGNKGEARVAAINAGERLAKIFIENDLIKEQAFNQEAENRFLLLYPSKESGSSVATSPANTELGGTNRAPLQYQIVERRNKGVIFIDNSGKINDNNIFIGTINHQRDMDKGTFKNRVLIALPDGTTIAEAHFEGIGTVNTAQISTFRDRQSHTVNINETTFKKDIVEFLTQRGYL